jgi:hypothetical protein
MSDFGLFSKVVYRERGGGGGIRHKKEKSRLSYERAIKEQKNFQSFKKDSSHSFLQLQSKESYNES